MSTTDRNADQIVNADVHASDDDIPEDGIVNVVDDNSSVAQEGEDDNMEDLETPNVNAAASQTAAATSEPGTQTAAHVAPPATSAEATERARMPTRTPRQNRGLDPWR